MIQSFLEKFQLLSKNNSEEIPSFTQVYLEGKLIAETFNKVEENAKKRICTVKILCIESAQRIIDKQILK
jgi:hypothetical protein